MRDTREIQGRGMCREGLSRMSSEGRRIWSVKNRFSDPTKVQKGRDRQRKDIEGDHQGKALKEGCCERRWARTGVSSREEINTNRHLARATTKSKSRTQAVSNGRVGRRVKNRGV